MLGSYKDGRDSWSGPVRLDGPLMVVMRMAGAAVALVLLLVPSAALSGIRLALRKGTPYKLLAGWKEFQKEVAGEWSFQCP